MPTQDICMDYTLPPLSDDLITPIKPSPSASIKPRVKTKEHLAREQATADLFDAIKRQSLSDVQDALRRGASYQASVQHDGKKLQDVLFEFFHAPIMDELASQKKFSLHYVSTLCRTMTKDNRAHECRG